MKLLPKATVFTIALASSFGFGFYLRDLKNGQLPGTRPLNTLLGVKMTSKALTAEGAFRENYARIISTFPRKVDPKDLKYAGMEGLVNALGDPHTNFFKPEIAKAFQEETRANFFGVGAKLGPDPLGALVPAVFEDGPAYKAGLRANDVITAVNGEKVSGKATDYIVSKVKGPEGTIVKLTVIRAGKDQPIEISIRRAKIITPTVEGKFLKESGVGYMSVSMFSEPTSGQFDTVLEKLEREGLKGLVIDMRGNPGGLLSVAAEMLGRFVDDDVVVTMKFRKQKDGSQETEVQKTPGGMVHAFGYPVVVLMNEESASAAEIFAGVLRDYGKATLVGEHSYGKSSVQNVFALRDGASAKVTIAKYFLPKGEDLGRKVDEDGEYISGGIQPDVKVEPNYDEGFVFGDPVKDNQLSRAIEVALKR